MIAEGESLADGGDAGDFAEWIRPHWPSMLRLAGRLAGRGDAEDVLQDAIGSAWRKREQFDPSRGTPGAWLLAIVADQASKTRRRRHPTVELVDYAVPDAGGSDVDLAAAVGRLSARQRQAVELYYYLGLPVTEVAEAMGCAPGTVKATLAAARTRLREDLESGS